MCIVRVLVNQLWKLLVGGRLRANWLPVVERSAVSLAAKSFRHQCPAGLLLGSDIVRRENKSSQGTCPGLIEVPSTRSGTNMSLPVELHELFRSIASHPQRNDSSSYLVKTYQMLMSIYQVLLQSHYYSVHHHHQGLEHRVPGVYTKRAQVELFDATSILVGSNSPTSLTSRSSTLVVL